MSSLSNLMICAFVAECTAVQIKLVLIEQDLTDALPHSDIAFKPPAQELWVIINTSTLCVNQVEDGVVCPTFLQRKACHSLKGCGRVSFVPAEVTHVKPSR